MNPRLRKNLILLVVLLLGSGAYYLYDVKWAAEKKAAEERKLKLLKGVDTKALIRIALERKKDPYEMIRTEKGWRFVKPVDAALDEDVMGSLLRTAEEFKESRRIGNVKNLAEFGLDKPGMTMTFGLKDKEDVVVRIGDRSPTREFRYATVGDGGVITLRLMDIEKFDREIFAFREKAFVNIMPEKAQKVVVTPRGGTPFTVVRKDKDKWEMTLPVKDRADSVDSEGVVSSLKWDKVFRFVEEEPKDLAKYGLDKPRLAVHIYTVSKEKPEDGILIGDRKELPPDAARGEKKPRTFYYARRLSGGPVMLMPERTFNDLPKVAFKLRHKTVLDYDVDHVTRIRIERPDGTVDVRRKGVKAWEIEAAPKGGKAEKLIGRHKHVDDLMWDIKWATAVAYVDEPGADLSKYGLAGEGVRRISVWLKKKKDGPEEKHTFLLGPLVDGEKAYGRMEGEKRLFAFAKKDVDKIIRSAFYLSERRLVKFDEPEEIQKIALAFPDGSEALVRRSGGGWAFEKPAGKKAEGGAIDAFLNAFRDFESEGEAPAGEAPDFAAFRVQIRLVGRDGKKRPPVTIAERASGDYLYARVGEKGPALRLKRKGSEDRLPKAVDDWVKEEKKEPSA